MRAKDVLPDDVDESDFNGITVRKGSVGAFLANANVLSDAAASAALRTSAEQDIIDALPALRALGLFDVMIIKDESLRAFVDAHS